MLKSYFKIAIRNLFKNKVISLINIAGLTLGMTGAILLLLNVQYELSFDQFHEKKQTIHKAYNKGIVDGRIQSWDVTSALLAPSLKQNYPDIKEATRLSGTSNLLSYGDKKLMGNGNITDPAFLSMFSFPLLKGNRQTALNDAHSIVLTEEMAKRIFGNEDPMNKVILADNADNFTVTGVMKELPGNTRFKFEYLLPWKYLQARNRENAAWDNQYAETFVELQPGAAIENVNNKISHIIQKETNNQSKYEVFLHPLSKLHLYGRFENGKPANGKINDVRFLSILAVVILLFACINFMNLSTARSEKRAKEVGVRKVMGAAKRSLVLQFIGESIVLATFAGMISLLLVQFLLPLFSELTRTKLDGLNYSPAFWIIAIAVVLITGIVAGSYPAFYLSSFKPARVLKGVLKNKNSFLTPRKVLVITQFVLSIVLINFTIIFKKQISYGKTREIGFEKEGLVFHPLSSDLHKNFGLVKNELINSGTAISVNASNTTVLRPGVKIGGLKWPGLDPDANMNFEILTSRADFVKTNGVQLLAGRDIDVATFPTDTASCLINEAALKVMGFKDPVGQVLIDESSKWTIVGVVKDFLIGAPGRATEPMLILGKNWDNVMNIRLNPGKPFLETAKNAELILKKYNPGFLTELQFADAEYAGKFKQANNVSSLINSFALIAIFISCLGLFGLAAYMAENKTREIGIRKVLGGSVVAIASLFTKYFLKLVFIAILIASPIAWLLMNFFLQQFSYRTTLSWWILASAGAAALLIALITISFQSIKAALANPVKSLRVE